MTIGYEMAEAASKAGVDGDVIVTKPTVRRVCGCWGDGVGRRVCWAIAPERP